MPAPTLPTPTRHAEIGLAPVDSYLLHRIRTQPPIFLRGTPAELAALISLPSVPVEDFLSRLEHLAALALILHCAHHDGTHSAACQQRVYQSFRREYNLNAQRRGRGTSEKWPFRAELRGHFRNLEKRLVSKPSSTDYTKPSAFLPLLKEHPHSHLEARPASVEIFAGPYYPAELSGLLRAIEEQQSAKRSVFLLYTRKAIHLGLDRAR